MKLVAFAQVVMLDIFCQRMLKQKKNVKNVHFRIAKNVKAVNLLINVQNV
jgi:hypothetical protein